MSQTLSDHQLNQYKSEGYLLVEAFFSNDEISALKSRAKSDHELDSNSYGRGDGEGGEIRRSLWNQPGNGIYGAFARSQRIVKLVGELLDDEPYHYHSKMIMKDAKVGGAWAWHQDYGYWYQNAVLQPNLVSAFIAVDKATRENGCLQVIPRSHLYGRIDHTLTGEQAGADLERVEQIQNREELVYVAMSPGDVIFFHPNLLHRSDQNKSDAPRWSMICCYNARSNQPYKESRHPFYSPIDIVPDDKVIQFAEADADQMSWHKGSTPTAETLATDEQES